MKKKFKDISSVLDLVTWSFSIVDVDAPLPNQYKVGIQEEAKFISVQTTGPTERV